MALDINGYNDTFRAFTDFAQAKVNAGQSKAVARAPVDVQTGALAGRTITAATTDKVFKWFRSPDDVKANDATRKIFRDAIIDMFGGESKIPASVKKAMIEADYGQGKPLSARRIMAVKQAIDENGAPRQKVLEGRIGAAVLAKGYTKAELPNVVKAADLYARAAGCSELDALEEVSKPGTKANRLLNYGGRFLDGEKNFGNGLRLLDDFDKWFGKTEAELKQIHRDGGGFRSGMTKTLLNGTTSIFAQRCKPSLERFVFEHLAHDRSANLSGTDPEKLFGLANNAATSCIGRNFSFSRTQTFMQIPPEKRTTFFKALNVLSPPYASNPKQASVKPAWRQALLPRDLGVPVARILKNLDQVAELEAKGKLTSANLVKLCFPEIPEPGKNPEIDVKNFLDRVSDDINGGTYGGHGVAMEEAMNATGCSVEEALQFAKGETVLGNVPYYSTGTMEFHQLGDLDFARNQLMGDIDRADDNYRYNGTPLHLDNPAFRFNFADESLAANQTEQGKANIPRIAKKIEDLCGSAHRLQATSLMMMMSQSGLGIMKGGLMSYGVFSNEHSSLDFTLSKDPASGDVTVRYSAPKGLPFRLEWSATVDVKGNVSTTTPKFIDPASTAANMKAHFANSTNRHIDAANKAADRLVELAKGDYDLLALLQAHNCDVAHGITFGVNKDGKCVRPDAEIDRRFEALRSNLNELRTVANGNKRVFDVGMKNIAMFGGTALPPGLLTQLFEAIAKEDAGSLLNVSAESKPQEIFKSLAGLNNLVNKILNESKVIESFAGAGIAEADSLKGMIMGLALANCDEEALSHFRHAIYSANGTKMTGALLKLSQDKFPPDCTLPPNDREAAGDFSYSFYNRFFLTAAGAANEALGREGQDMPPAPTDAVDPNDFNAMLDQIMEDGVRATRQTVNEYK